ncbi:olfactory receptor 11L1-like [Mantella aurantiaca]
MMEMSQNHTSPSTFYLIGFSVQHFGRIPLFLCFLCIYLLTVLGNLLIILVSWLDVHLHKPMYYFLMNLSILEVLYTTTVTPKLLQLLMASPQGISVAACFTQMYFFCACGGAEGILLAIMAYDRYLAICRPLNYPKLMHSRVCHNLSIGTWCVGFLASLLPAVSISTLPFCSVVIDHFFCDLFPVLRLSCLNTWLIEMSIFVLTCIMAFGPFSWTLISYLFIIVMIMQMSSATSREKAFSTCASHLAVVSIYYVTVITMYMGKGSQSLNKVLSILYSIVTPLCNPFIYSLRNKDVRKALHDIWH